VIVWYMKQDGRQESFRDWEQRTGILQLAAEQEIEKALILLESEGRLKNGCSDRSTKNPVSKYRI